MGKPTLWIDITELFGEFTYKQNPTGVSRVVISIVDGIKADPGAVFGQVRPFFWHPVRNRPFFAELDGSLETFLASWSSTLRQAGMLAEPRWPGLKRRLSSAVPKPYRYAVFPSTHGVMQFARWARRDGIRLQPAGFEQRDCVFMPGSFWLGGYLSFLLTEAQNAGALPAAYVHDVLPIAYPHWFGPKHSEQFRRGAELLLPNCAAIACNSEATKAAMKQYISLPDTLAARVCRLGDVAEKPAAGPIGENVKTILQNRYVLFVSSIIGRKNHDLLVAAWSKMHAEMGPDTPRLICVGGGQPTTAMEKVLTEQQTDANWLILLRNISDAELDALYAAAWMTAYPSLDEGYGLPVAEALVRGRICMASNRGGMADVAPELVEIIDPENAETVIEVVRSYLQAPEKHRRREEQIRRDYKATSWKQTALDVRTLLEEAVTAARTPV